MSKTKVSYDEFLQSIFHRFAKESAGELVSLDDCYDYARTHKLWEPKRLSQRALFKREMSRAISRERVRDEDGNPIRPNLAIKVKRPDGQGYFYWWGEMLRMKPKHVHMSLKQRLLSIANRAIQLDRDKSYYNMHNTDGAQLEFDYNLTPHVEHARNPTEYPDERPDDEA